MARQVAFQGEPGAFSEDAIAAVWPNDAVSVPLPTFDDVVRAVADRRVDAGVLPVENTIAGPVSESIAALEASDAVHIVAEASIRITQCLLGTQGARIENLATVESHPMALAQCRSFLQRHARIGVVPVWNTAGAAHAVALAKDPRRGAIAGRNAARRYGLTILADGIEDDPANHTRFVIVTSVRGTVRPVSSLWRRFHAVRGAISVEVDEPGAIREATHELLRTLMLRNFIKIEHIVSVLFSATSDLTSDFPARAARDLGWTDTPLMCMTEIPVPGALGRCIRVMVHVELEYPRAAMIPIYLRGAEALRRDIAPSLALAQQEA
ncbi:MAG TPA: chorismate mutase [Gemmatimonadaceae bacterium]|nr:chorismate mutase [Gemmatimonadaceae bacterium]